MYTTEYKLNLAKSVIADYCGDTAALENKYPDFKAIQKMERKYTKSKGRYCDISNFCIRLSDIPEAQYKLMVTINWLNHITAAPAKNQVGFYKSVYSDKQGIARIEYFITLDKYIQLLFIELNIKEIYQ
ncbi:MAG TPA: hypothetical protein VKR58_10835 [Aquella sp.]|nr:hypothetical protein [Aquella sp.]